MKYVDRKPVIDAVYDLIWLSELAQGNPSGHDIRRSTTVLRNLLIYHRIQDAWNRLDLPGRPCIETNTIELPRLRILINGVPAQRTADDDNNIVALAPPVRGGVPFTRCLSLSSYWNGANPISTRNRMKISAFLNSAGIFSMGEKISRRSAIEFVCHKRGGAHLDWNVASAAIQAAYDPQLPGPGDYCGVEEFSVTIKGLNDLERYILNIIKDLVDARDIQSLMQKASETVLGNALLSPAL